MQWDPEIGESCWLLLPCPSYHKYYEKWGLMFLLSVLFSDLLRILPFLKVVVFPLLKSVLWCIVLFSLCGVLKLSFMASNTLSY